LCEMDFRSSFESDHGMKRIPLVRDKELMKPIHRFSDERADATRRWPYFPLTDCCYQTPPYVDLGGGHCAPRSSFRNISRDYFRDEAPYHFAAEAVLFAAMIVTAGSAVAIGTVAAIDFLRALGYL
jgi:hypothetical protein